MRLLMLASTAAAVALAPVLVTTPAHAQNSDVLGQVQRFLGGNNNSTDARNAYEQGRQDQRRQEQARRDHWRAEHEQYGQNRGHDYQHSRNYDSDAYNNGYNYNRY